jgi:voltage-gated potassium channel Kch
MSDWYGTQHHSIGIVGGGRAGLGLFNFFQGSRIGSVVYVVDPDIEAPAVLAARSADVRVFDHHKEAIRQMPCDIIFEVTGKDSLAEELQQLIAGTQCRLVDHRASRVVVQVQDENLEVLRTDLTGSLTKIRTEIGSSLDGSRNVVSRINQIMSSMQMLALNASIEAAKVGVYGKGFMVVADHMTKSVESVRNLTKEIETLNSHIMQVSAQIDTTLGRLK